MSLFFCYTTVFQAMELFALAESQRERRIMEDAMSAMKILGMNPKNAALYGKLFAKSPKSDALAVLTAGLCIESRLPLLTGNAKEFRGIAGLKIVPARLLSRHATAAAILRAA